MRCSAFAALAALALAPAAFADAFQPADVLIYTRWKYVWNAKAGVAVPKGAYHHISTEVGAEQVRRYFGERGYSCLVTDDPAFFTSAAMKNLKLVFLCNCNHELFETDAQREAFYSFVENGGGLLATHSSSACERGSKRFKDFLGGAFYTHHPQFPVPFDGIDRSHPAFAAFPEGYVWAKDEIYINHKGLDAADIQGIRPLLTMDWKASKGYKEGNPDKYILAWCKTFGKGRIFYTALGHNPSDWGKMEWQLHLLEAARWAMGELPDSLATPSSAAFSRATIDGAIMNDARASSRSALGETVSWTGYRVAYIAE